MASLDHSELNHRHTILSQLRLFYIYNYISYIQSFGTYKLVWYMLYLLLNRKQLANIFYKTRQWYIHSVTKNLNKYLSKWLFHKALHIALKGLFCGHCRLPMDDNVFHEEQTSPIGRKREPFQTTGCHEMGRVSRRPLSELLFWHPFIYLKLLLLIWRSVSAY